MTAPKGGGRRVKILSGAQRCLTIWDYGKVTSHDFIEGVRVVIIDKDHSPKWNPTTLEEVSGANVDLYLNHDLGEYFSVMCWISE